MGYTFENVEIEEGEVRWTEFPVATDADLRTESVPVCIAHGGPGPVIWMQGCVHGPEQVGTVAVRDFVRTIDPGEITGTVIAVPVVNRVAFANKTRTAPIDHEDLNRQFPGASDGSYTERLADALFTRAHAHANYVIDLHTGGNEFMIPGYSIYPLTDNELEEEARELCRVADLPYAIGIPQEFLSGAMYAELSERGTPSIILEAGGEGRLHEDSVRDASTAIRNITRHLGLLSGDLEQRHQVSFHEGMDILKAREGGLFEAVVDGNERVEEGQELARITDITGETRERIDSPYDGVVVAVRTYAIARPGDWIFEMTPE